MKISPIAFLYGVIRLELHRVTGIRFLTLKSNDEKNENMNQFKKLLIVKQIFLVRVTENVRKLRSM